MSASAESKVLRLCMGLIMLCALPASNAAPPLSPNVRLQALSGVWQDIKAYQLSPPANKVGAFWDAYEGIWTGSAMDLEKADFFSKVNPAWNRMVAAIGTGAEKTEWEKWSEAVNATPPDTLSEGQLALFRAIFPGSHYGFDKAAVSSAVEALGLGSSVDPQSKDPTRRRMNEHYNWYFWVSFVDACVQGCALDEDRQAWKWFYEPLLLGLLMHAHQDSRSPPRLLSQALPADLQPNPTAEQIRTYVAGIKNHREVLLQLRPIVLKYSTPFIPKAAPANNEQSTKRRSSMPTQQEIDELKKQVAELTARNERAEKDNRLMKSELRGLKNPRSFVVLGLMNVEPPTDGTKHPTIAGLEGKMTAGLPHPMYDWECPTNDCRRANSLWIKGLEVAGGKNKIPDKWKWSYMGARQFATKEAAADWIANHPDGQWLEKNSELVMVIWTTERPLD